MTKRALIAVVALLFLTAACGREGDLVGDLAAEGGKQAAEATATPSAPGQASPSATDAVAAPASSTPAATSAGGGAAPAPQPVAEGGANPPKDGRYVYTYSGQQTDPFNPGSPPQKFNGELTTEISHQGNVYTEEQTNTETPGRFTTRTRWEASRILFLAFKSETAGGDFSCTFDPPLVIARFPIKPGTIPTQTFKGEGNACTGKLDVTVVGKEDVKDATGRTWSTWRVKIRIEAGGSQFTTVTDDVQWFSPVLGVEVRSDGKTHGEIRTPTGSQTFDGTAVTALKSHP